MRTLAYFDLRYPPDHPDRKLAGQLRKRDAVCACGAPFVQTYANKEAIQGLSQTIKNLLAASTARDGDEVVWPAECTRCLRRSLNDPHSRTR